MTEAEPIDHQPWPLRALILLSLGASIGLLIHHLTRGAQPWMWTDNRWQLAAATLLAVGGIVFAFSLERLRWAWAAGFAAAGGLIVAFVGWWHGSPQEWGQGEGWQFFASLLAVAIAVPLFQAARDSGRRRFEEEVVHAHAWTNLILWCAAWAFVGATLLLVVLLSELFNLIGLDQLRRLLDKGWFMWPLACGALGAAVGLLRDRDKVLGTLQRVVRAVLSVLAPVLALGLLVFVLALPFTGLEPLWSQTKATTPILLVCILGAVVLANAVIGNSADEEAPSPMLRWPALALATVILPLALVAAVSTGKRIGQYGFTPDRLWAAVFVAVAAAAALAYLLALVRGRRGWPERLRRANVRLAAGICLLALFLALPIVSFGAISARDQLARLQSGQVPPDRFDWAAMRFDFGPSGRKALERLAAGNSPVLRQRAREALDARDRWAIPGNVVAPARAASTEPPKVRVDGGGTIPAPLLDRIAQSGQCRGEGCRLVFVAPARTVLFRTDCRGCLPHVFDGRPDGTWVQRLPEPQIAYAPAPPDGGRVEVRTVERHQVFVDGKPAGPAF
jgi:Domain of unknown function (DUF4153)